VREVRDRYNSLSPRERQVMSLVVSGLLNKQIGGELHITEITVKAHRGRVMRKINAESLAALVRMAANLPSRFVSLRSRPTPLRDRTLTARFAQDHRTAETVSYVSAKTK
jgi:DNA-binding NarL/FixJ family response regulator